MSPAPDFVSQTQLSAYRDYLWHEHGHRFDNYRQLGQWSITGLTRTGKNSTYLSNGSCKVPTRRPWSIHRPSTIIPRPSHTSWSSHATSTTRV